MLELGSNINIDHISKSHSIQTMVIEFFLSNIQIYPLIKGLKKIVPRGKTLLHYN